MALILTSGSLWLLQPYVLGVAINDLVEESWRGVAFLGALQIVVMTIGAMRRYYDTRVYTRIYRHIGAETVTSSQEAGLELTRITARANMLREVVRFFEFRLPATLRSLINLIGSLALLAFLSRPVFYACLAAMAVVFLISLVFSRLLLRLNARLNDQLEREVEVFESREQARTKDHLEKLATFQVRQSDLEVTMFGLSGIALTAVLLFSLYQIVLVESAAIGTVFAVFSYVTRFQQAVNTFPGTYQELIRTLEITRRINDIDVAPLVEDETKRAAAREAALVQRFFAGRRP